MEVQQVLHMNAGAGDTSYVNNSSLQRTAIDKAKPIVINAILDLFKAASPEMLSIADLGCSSGPNTLLVISEMIDAIDGRCRDIGRPLPEFRVFLNDLYSNDFNTLFRSLPSFHEKLRKERGNGFRPCYLAGVPGSFYGRLFPDSSLHFIHSAASLHWLSQVPTVLESENGITLNKGNIYIGKSSPPLVFKAYLEQFQRDFSLFLSSRSREMVAGGRMVLALLGRRSHDPYSGECGVHWGLLAQSLNDMVSQGIVEEAKVTSYNMPYYTPSVQELKDAIKADGSFNLDRLEVQELNWDPTDDDDDNDQNFVFHEFKSAQNVAKSVRAISESMLVSHFGEVIIEDLFRRFTCKVAEHLSKEKTKHLNLVISMTKK